MLPIIVLGLILSVSGEFSFEQHDYFIAFERVEVSRYNREYFKFAEVVTFKYNRTQAVCNGSFDLLKDVGSDAEVIVQAYTFLSNEYRLFPIRFSLNFCKSLKSNNFGLGDIVQEGLFSGCPIKKGIIRVYNWKPNPSRFPPHIPNGQYKLELQILHFSSEVFVMEAFGIVYRPLGRRH